jgi:hypothetical protein
MTPDGAVQLLDLYARVQGAIERDETEQADALLRQADALIAEVPPAGSDVAVLRALAIQVQAVRGDAEEAMIAARDRLQRSARVELRAGGDGARAYAGHDERPEARFIDHRG